MIRIEGDVAAPRTLGFDDLAELPGQVPDVGEVARGRVGTAVVLQSILDAVAASPAATKITLESADGKFVQTAPLVAAVKAALVVYRLGEGPLPAEQGGPVRFLIPNVEDCEAGGVDRCTNVKALAVIRLGSD